MRRQMHIEAHLQKQAERKRKMSSIMEDITITREDG